MNIEIFVFLGAKQEIENYNKGKILPFSKKNLRFI